MSTQQQPAVGVAAALQHAKPTRRALNLFTLPDKVALVTGGHRGIGLETALALAEVGATVYCLDVDVEPDEDWLTVQKYAKELAQSMPAKEVGRLRYVKGDVTNQQEMFDIAERIVGKEGHIDICVANAGILRGAECLEYPAEDFRKLHDVNVNGALFTAQAAGRQMVRLGTRGSIIFTASMSGGITNKDHHWVAYNTSKAAVIQMARSMACELGPKGIRVNSISPGYIYTQMTKNFLDTRPNLMADWASQNPLGRLGQPDELRGVVLWLSGEGSTFCTGSDIIVDGGHTAW